MFSHRILLRASCVYTVKIEVAFWKDLILSPFKHGQYQVNMVWIGSNH